MYLINWLDRIYIKNIIKINKKIIVNHFDKWNGRELLILLMEY
jgi:hypothetical protein